MRKKWCLGVIMGVCVGLFVAQVQAGEILKVIDSAGNLGPFSTFPSVANSYKVALEVYNPSLTTTSSAKGVVALKFGPTEITGGKVQAPHTVSFSFPDGDATFAVVGPNYRWALVDPNTGDVFAISTAGSVGSTISLTPAQVDCSSNTGETCDIPSDTDLYLVQAEWSDSDDDGLVDAEELDNVTYVSVNLKNKPADCNTFPVWPLAASIAGANGNIAFQTVTFAYVTPQLEVVYPGNDALNAELDSDKDFAEFVLGSGPNVNTSTQILAVGGPPGFFGLNDLQTSEPWNWIAWTTGPQVRITFNLNSAISEPDVTSIKFNAVSCPETTTDKVWSCDSGVGTPPYDLDLNVSGTTPNNPTVWTLTNLNIVSSTGTPICYNTQPRTVGAWWGGLEAIVPFVKSDPTVGAQTYIVLYNRRNVDVPVYARAMLMDSDPIVVSTTEPIATIPAQGSLQLTADDLKAMLPELANYDMAKGVPIKFLFRVPTQSGNMPYIIQGNPFDPYIEGIVVSVYGTEQRSVPLKFKVFKQGSYNE